MPLFSTEHSKRKIENPSKSEVIGRCGGDEKTEWPRRTHKSPLKKHTQKTKTWLNENVLLIYTEYNHIRIIRG